MRKFVNYMPLFVQMQIKAENIFFSTIMLLVHHLIVFWDTPVSFPIKKKSKFARDMNNFRLDSIYDTKHFP